MQYAIDALQPQFIITGILRISGGDIMRKLNRPPCRIRLDSALRFMAKPIRKSKLAFFKKLYLAHIIGTGKHDLNSIEAVTGFPRGTIVTAMKGLPDICIEYKFVQDGPRNRHGYYEITEWGPFKPWIKKNIDMIMEVVEQGQ